MHSSLPLQITDWKFSRRRSVINAVSLGREAQRARRLRGGRYLACGGERGAKRAAPARVASSSSTTSRWAAAPRPQEVAARARTLRHRSGARSSCCTPGSFVALQALDLLIAAIPKVVAAVPDVHVPAGRRSGRRRSPSCAARRSGSASSQHVTARAHAAANADARCIWRGRRAGVAACSGHQSARQAAALSRFRTARRGHQHPGAQPDSERAQRHS